MTSMVLMNDHDFLGLEHDLNGLKHDLDALNHDINRLHGLDHGLESLPSL